MRQRERPENLVIRRTARPHGRHALRLVRRSPGAPCLVREYGRRFQTFGRPGRNTLDIRPVGGMARRTDIRPAATLDRLRCGRRGGRGGTVQVGHIYASRRCRPGPIRPLCPERRVRQQMRLSRSGDLPAASGPGHARRHRCFRPEGPERPSGVDNGLRPGRRPRR